MDQQTAPFPDFRALFDKKKRTEVAFSRGTVTRAGWRTR